MSLLRKNSVTGLEVQNVGDRDAIEMRTDAPGREQFRIDELVNGFAIELPTTAELRNGQPRGRVIDNDLR